MEILGKINIYSPFFYVETVKLIVFSVVPLSAVYVSKFNVIIFH